jgi:hypothetical protein
MLYISCIFEFLICKENNLSNSHKQKDSEKSLEPGVPYPACLPEVPTASMASPPCLLRLRPCPPSCGRSRSRSKCFHLSKQSQHPLTSRRPCRRPVWAPVGERLAPRSPGTGRWTGIFACRCSYDAENGTPTPPPDMVLFPTKCCAVGIAMKFVSLFGSSVENRN